MSCHPCQTNIFPPTSKKCQKNLTFSDICSHTHTHTQSPLNVINASAKADDYGSFQDYGAELLFRHRKKPLPDGDRNVPEARYFSTPTPAKRSVGLGATHNILSVLEARYNSYRGNVACLRHAIVEWWFFPHTALRWCGVIKMLCLRHTLSESVLITK